MRKTVLTLFVLLSQYILVILLNYLSDFRGVFKIEAQAEHPHFVARQSDFDKIRNLIQQGKNPWKAQFDKVMIEAEGIPEQPDLWDDEKIKAGDWEEYKGKADTGSSRIARLSLAYALSGDQEIYQKAENHLLGWSNEIKLSLVDENFTAWNHSHPMDSLVINMSLAYDWLFGNPGFSQTEKNQFLNWLRDDDGNDADDAAVFIRERHEAEYRSSNQKAWDNAALMLAGLTLEDEVLIDYVIDGADNHASGDERMMHTKALIAGMTRDDGCICDSYYGCQELWHSLLTLNAFSLISSAAIENGYENLFATQPKLVKSFDFYAPVYQTNDIDSLGEGFGDVPDWLYFSGVYEIGYKYLPDNSTIYQTLTDPDFNEGDGRYCENSRSQCTRWTKYASLIWGQEFGNGPSPTPRPSPTGGFSPTPFPSVTPGPSPSDSSFEARKQEFFDEVIRIADRTFIDCQDFDEDNGVVLDHRNNIWPLLERGVYPQLQRCMIKNMLHGLGNSVACWEEIDDGIHAKCGSDTVGILEEQKLENPDNWYETLDHTQGFFNSVQYDNALILRVLYQYPHRLSSEQKREIETEYKKTFITGEYGEGCFQISTNPNQRIQSAVGIYLWLDKHPEDRNVTFTYKQGSCSHYGTWENFSCQGRNYTTGGVYNIWQFAQDYLNCVVFPNLVFADGDYSNEFDATYTHAFFAPLPLLIDYASDENIRRRAKMALDTFSLDFFMDHGADHHCGARGRGNYYTEGVQSALGYMWFGISGDQADHTSVPFPSSDRYVSGYVSPGIIRDLVDTSDESAGFWRITQENNYELNEPELGKGTYITRDYGLGGFYGGYAG